MALKYWNACDGSSLSRQLSANQSIFAAARHNTWFASNYHTVHLWCYVLA